MCIRDSFVTAHNGMRRCWQRQMVHGKRNVVAVTGGTYTHFQAARQGLTGKRLEAGHLGKPGRKQVTVNHFLLCDQGPGLFI